MEEFKKELIAHRDDIQMIQLHVELLRNDLERFEKEGACCYKPIITANELEELLGQGDMYIMILNTLILKMERSRKHEE